jgi:lipopolysaccharide export system protein LptA
MVVLALCASAPHGALAQDASSAPEAAATAAPTAAGSSAALPGASIRKPPRAAAAGGAPAAAGGGDASAAAPSAEAPPAAAGAADSGGAGAQAGAGGTETPAASAGGVAPSGETSAAPNTAAPGSVGGAEGPAALATAAPRAKARPIANGKHRGAQHAHSESATQSASAKTDSKDTATDSKNDKDSKESDSPFSSLQFSGNKGPVDIKSDTLDLDYKGNIITFRGHVHAVQADATLTSDTLTVTYGKDFHEVQKMVANDNVRMSQGTRWATGDHAVLDQAKHTVTLTGSPVVHDGEDQVTGSKITVHLDTGKSEVEGARAVFFPKDKKTRDNKTTVAKSP